MFFKKNPHDDILGRGITETYYCTKFYQKLDQKILNEAYFV